MGAMPATILPRRLIPRRVILGAVGTLPLWRHAAAQGTAPAFRVTLLHLNDFHSRHGPVNDRALSCQPGVPDFGRVVPCDLPGQVVIPRPGRQLVDRRGHTPVCAIDPPAGSTSTPVPMTATMPRRRHRTPC